MVKTIKKYQLLKGHQLSTHFVVGKNLIPVTFQGGTRRPYVIRGRFATTDPLLQKAIEEDISFNVLFFLEKTETFGEEEVKEKTHEPSIDKVPVKEEIPPEKPIEEVPTADALPADGPKDYPEVTTVKDARQKLLELFPKDFKPSQMPNKPAVLSKAKGKNISFSNLV